MTTSVLPTPSVASMGLSKAEYIELCDTLRDKAQQAHQDARGWMNRALVAEAQLAVLRAAYEPAASNPQLTPRPDVRLTDISKSMNNQPTTKEGN